VKVTVYSTTTTEAGVVEVGVAAMSPSSCLPSIFLIFLLLLLRSSGGGQSEDDKRLAWLASHHSSSSSSSSSRSPSSISSSHHNLEDQHRLRDFLRHNTYENVEAVNHRRGGGNKNTKNNISGNNKWDGDERGGTYYNDNTNKVSSSGGVLIRHGNKILNRFALDTQRGWVDPAGLDLNVSTISELIVNLRALRGRERRESKEHGNNNNNGSSVVIVNDVAGQEAALQAPPEIPPNMTWPLKRVAKIEGDIWLGGLMMVHERQDEIVCGPIMPQVYIYFIYNA